MAADIEQLEWRIKNLKEIVEEGYKGGVKNGNSGEKWKNFDEECIN